MYRLIVFDWDGTLIDSGAMIVESIQQAARAAGVGNVNAKLIRHSIGLNYEIVLNKIMPHRTRLQEKKFTEYYNYYMDSLSKQSVLFKGTKKVLELLQLENYWLAIATGKSRQELTRDFNHLNISSFFITTRCGDEVFSKPHPQMLLEILEETGADASETLMIGDTEYDIQLAQNAGVDALAATYGLHARDRLLSQSIVGHINRITELPKWLKHQQKSH